MSDLQAFCICMAICLGFVIHAVIIENGLKALAQSIFKALTMPPLPSEMENLRAAYKKQRGDFQ